MSEINTNSTKPKPRSRSVCKYQELLSNQCSESKVFALAHASAILVPIWRPGEIKVGKRLNENNKAENETCGTRICG